MRAIIFTLLLISLMIPNILLHGQYRGELTGIDVLRQSVKYHDPEDKWNSFEGTLYLRGKLPIGKDTYTVITLNNQYQFYQATRKINGRMVTSGVRKGSCFAQIDGDPQLSSDLVEKYHLECDEVLGMRNYHTYMIGMPMKLQDSEATVNRRVNIVPFQGRNHYEVEVSYDPGVGADKWFFYIDTETYALKGYRFVKDGDDDNGEYVVFSGEIFLGGLRIPSTRKWYTYDNIYLGTDDLIVGKYFHTPDALVGR